MPLFKVYFTITFHNNKKSIEGSKGVVCLTEIAIVVNMKVRRGQYVQLILQAIDGLKGVV